jgi:hypothetical protein
MARSMVRADERQARIPGAYAHLLSKAQRDHDRPDPRTMYWDESAVRPDERNQLIAQAKWRKPSMRHAKLLAGQPVTVRKYAAVPPSRRRQTVADIPWWNDPTITFVRVTKDDLVAPGDERDYLAPGPVQ